METFEEFLNTIEDVEHRNKLKSILAWVSEKYPYLKQEVKWNQPMFSNEGTYIIGFSTAKKHIAVSPEKAGMVQFGTKINEAGYSSSEMIFRIGWDEKVDYDLLADIIDYQIKDKEGYSHFWRKAD